MFLCISPSCVSLSLNIKATVLQVLKLKSFLFQDIYVTKLGESKETHCILDTHIRAAAAAAAASVAAALYSSYSCS